MTLGILFWVLLIVGTVFRFYYMREPAPSWSFEVPYVVLLALLGVAVFGYPIR